MPINTVILANTQFLSNQDPTVKAARSKLIILAAIAGSQVVAERLGQYPTDTANLEAVNSYRLAATLANESREMSSAVNQLQQKPDLDLVPQTWNKAFYAVALKPDNKNILQDLVPTDAEYTDFMTALATADDYASTAYGTKLNTVLTMAADTWGYAANYIYGVDQLEASILPDGS